MSYKEKPQLKLYSYEDEQFILKAIIDDYQSISFERNLYQAGQFTIQINFNIPNASKFEKNLFVQFANDPYDFGEIYNIVDSISSDGKASQMRTISGYDARYIFKRRIIKQLNFNDTWSMTAKGEICMRNLILDQAGNNAESKRRLPITNIIPNNNDAIGKDYTVSEAFTNLYDVLCTIATQSEIGWRIKFDGTLILEFYQGEDLSEKVSFSTDFESLANGNFNDTKENFTNAVYIGGKGNGSERDIYDGENIDVPFLVEEGKNCIVDEDGNFIVIDYGEPDSLDRFESWDDQSELTTIDEYRIRAESILNQYLQNLVVSGSGLAKCPYIYKQQYNVGDKIKISFSNKSVVVQILSVTENWQKGAYNLTFNFGKPQNDFKDQIQLLLRKIRVAGSKSNTIDCVKWYNIPGDTEQSEEDVTFNTLGFTGEGGTFILYLNSNKAGSKRYMIYGKNLTGDVTLTTGYAEASNVTIPSGNSIATIYVDTEGNILKA